MTSYDVKRFALVLAIQAEIEGMKAYNADRAINNVEPGYRESDFGSMAEQLRNLAAKENDEL